jgi:hypothetical protein
MVQKYLTCVMVLFLVLNVSVFAQEEDVRSVVEYKVNKMKTELNLTDSQARAIRPVIKEYLIKHEAFLHEAAGQGILDHFALKSSLKGLKENEYQKLRMILNEDQMKKLVNKDNLMATLNPDSVESSVDDGAALTANGANFKF